MQDLRLSTHFRLSEFTRSDKATRLGIDNTPSLEVVSNLQHLCDQVLEPLRAHINAPIHINSGYRSLALNRALKSKDTSQHIRGEAADIRIPSRAVGLQYASFIQSSCVFDQLLLETDSHGTVWLHVSCRRTANRRLFNPDFKV